MIRHILIACFCAILFVNAHNSFAQEKPAVPKVVSGGVLNGKAKNLAIPEYPEAAKAVGAAGAVNVQVTLDENGDVVSAAATTGHPLLRASAVEAARASKFTPTKLSGQPVKVTGVIVYNFTANGAPANGAIANNVSTPPRAIKESHLLAGMFLSIYANAESHSSLEQMLTSATQILPTELAAEKQRLSALSGDAQAKRAEVAAVIISIGGKLSGDAAWQFGVGQSVGEIAVEARSFKYKQDYQPNQDVLRRNLLNIRSSLSAPPADLSKTTVDLLQQFAVHADSVDLSDAKMLDEFMRVFMQLSQSFKTATVTSSATSSNDD